MIFTLLCFALKPYTCTIFIGQINWFRVLYCNIQYNCTGYVIIIFNNSECIHTNTIPLILVSVLSEWTNLAFGHQWWHQPEINGTEHNKNTICVAYIIHHKSKIWNILTNTYYSSKSYYNVALWFYLIISSSTCPTGSKSTTGWTQISSFIPCVGSFTSSGR